MATAPSTQHPTPLLVGRETELEQLHKWLGKVINGEHQLSFVTGEAGIGKTALVEAFLEEVGAGPRACPPPGQPQGVAPTVTQTDIWIARGQCIEQFGVGDAYLPVLDALGALSRGPAAERLREVLLRYAPTWVVLAAP